MDPKLSLDAQSIATKIVYTWIRQNNFLWIMIPIRVQLIKMIAYAIDKASNDATLKIMKQLEDVSHQ